MVYCMICGTENNYHADYYRECGHQLKKEEEKHDIFSLIKIKPIILGFISFDFISINYGID